MASPASRKVFVNLPVRDLKKSMRFFEGLGFTFNPQFTDDNAACMVFSDEGFAMLLAEPFFRTFTRREPCDTTGQSEVLIALSCASRAEVDEIVDKALATGATIAMPPQDHGFMFVRTFYDLDGHHWEFLWMDPSQIAS
jgi:predicted lactoylglutathione lyase